MKLHSIFSIVVLIVLSAACARNSGTAAPAPEAPAHISSFCADSAYAYIAAQTAMGPRVPGSPAHSRCADWLSSELARHGANVAIQDTVMPSTDGTLHPVKNIIGSFRPDAQRRIMLLAHYDTRPWADQDADTANHDKPIDGANDGASGVGVILEICRHASELPDNTGLIVLFVDTEDAGSYADDASWCLGSQAYAASISSSPIGRPEYAILLDMVGAHDAVFSREYFSQNLAPATVAKIWSTAAAIGHGDRFSDNVGGAINDDHVHLLALGIPAVDIIEMSNPLTGSFHPSWHTMADNIDIISKATLKAVGETVLETVKKK